jgi:hypothetical protein
MAYDPDEHGRLVSLHLTYATRVQSTARAADDIPPLIGGMPADPAQSYQDALTTAHAVCAYLQANPVMDEELHHEQRALG